MAVFFTADTHFGHGGALGLFRRPFASVAAMDEALVETWNTVVGPRIRTLLSSRYQNWSLWTSWRI